MNRKALKTCVGILASALGILMGTSEARAQTAPPPIPGDWGSLGAYVNRQHRNGDPQRYNPGRNDLRWTTQNTVADRAVLTLDNTDSADRFYSVYGNGTLADPGIDDPLYNAGRVALTNGSIAPYVWRGPVDVASEAGSPYTLAFRNRYSAATPTPPKPAGYTPNLRTRVPSYVFTECTPSLQGQSDPTQAQNASDLRYFEWTFTPPAGPDRNYQLYAYLPVGPTTAVTGTSGTQRLFPQRYYVYRIFYGDPALNLSYTDVVDTYAAGSGFVRLGNGGLATTRLFPFRNAKSDGSVAGYPIRVRLYNTVPRATDGTLLIDGAVPSMTIQAEQALARTRLVYADAARLTPQIGEYRASPVTQTITPGTTVPSAPDGDIDARVTVALNEYQTSTVDSALQQSTAGTVISYQSNPNRWPITDNTNPLLPRRETPLEVWRYSLAQESANAVNVDNPNQTTAAGGWTAATAAPHIGADYLTKPIVVDDNTTTPPTPPAIATATYAPTLDTGDYTLYAYVGGQKTGAFGTSVRFNVYQGGALVDTAIVNEDVPNTSRQGPGWVRLGFRRYRNVRDDNDSTNAAPLTVVVTNYSSNQADAGKLAYADAIRFVGDEDSAIDSTPVHATVKINNVDTKVVVVPDESGRIHCLDATGNTDGTTWEYWSYPTTTTLNDPNLTEGIDGTYNAALGADNVPTAIMPQGFDLSSAAVARVQTGGSATNPVYADYLYVGATNGRVYCIDMAGRGDYDRTTRKIGTTRRIWTYPDDYPTTSVASDLGAFRGSIVFGNADTGAGGTQTVYVPAYQGRIYALDALGSTNTRTTTVRWRYPEADQATLPNIVMTPTLFRLSTATGPNTGAGRLYFGTLRSSTDDSAGRLYCLDAETGDIVWQYNGGTTQNTNDVHDTGATLRYSATDVFSAGNGYDTANTIVNQFGSFVTGTLAVPASLLDGNKSATTPTAPVHVDQVYALNSNRFLYALNAATGVPTTHTDTAGTHRYATNDLDVLSDANLTFTFTSAYNRNATLVGNVATGLELFPTIIVPSNDGRMREAFARAEDYNVFDGYVADGVNFPASLNSAAASNNSTYLTDAMGSLYALDDKGAAGNNLIPGLYYGVNPVIPPNDPYGAIFRNLKIRLVNRSAYNALRNVDENGQGSLNWFQVNDPADPAYPGYQGPATTAGNPYAFEWGETAYVMVYDFPYATTDSNNNPVPAPTVTLTLSVDGKTVRQQQIDSRKYNQNRQSPPADGNPTDASGNVIRKDGYAIYPFTFNSAGSTALPPGPGKITATITTSSATGTAAEVLNDTRPSTTANSGSAINFRMANPLAIQVYDVPTATGTSSGIGNLLTASNVSNLVNGSPTTTDPVTKVTYPWSQLLASAGYANHGGSATARFDVYDRSLMVLVRPEGLNNVRLQRSNLERQGGQPGIIRPLLPSLYPNFEDSAATAYRPNRSLDYPNIGREQVRAAKDPNGNAENPILTAVTLRPPTSLSGGLVTELTLAQDGGNGVPNNRVVRPTPFEMTIDVPRYQPPVDLTGTTFNSPATYDPTDLLHRRRNYNNIDTLPQGYFGRVQVFVDSNNDLTRNEGTSSEAYRALNYSVAVQPQASLLTGTPSVDLGSLAAGTGYDALDPANALGRNTRGRFNPWVGEWKDAYRPIVIRNDGNVNMLDLRITKAKNETPPPGTSPDKAKNEIWGIYSEDNDPMAWLSAALLDGNGNLQPGSLWSNIDTTFSPTNRFGGGNLVILQKPRVTDRTPTELLVNPYPRANPNLPGLTANGRTPFDGRINTDVGFDLKNSTQPNVGISVPIGFPVGNYSTEVRVFENLYGDDQILNLLRGQYEPYSDPITVSFKVRETRMTNRVTPKTAPMIDNPANFGLNNNLYDPNLGQTGDDRKRFRNAAPAALRMGNGALAVVWESDRLAKAADTGVPLADYPSLLYFAGLGMTGNVTMSQNGTGAPLGNSPLYDLTQFKPATNDQWFTPGNGGNGYPSNTAGLFPEGTAIQATLRFNSPAFAQGGVISPFGGTFTSPYMAFVGNTQVSTATGRLSLSRVFIAPVAMNGAVVTPGDPIPVPGDPQTAKGKPSVLQLGNAAGIVFYAETSAGQSAITATRFSGGAFAAPVPLGFGDGFSSVFSPSVTARGYRRTGQPMVEMSFAGKLRGRPNAEVYLSRMLLNANTGTLVDGNGQSVESKGAGSPFALMAEQGRERLVNEGAGVYRARGVLWSRQANIQLVQTAANGADTSLFASAPTIERQSGLIAYDSRLGGKVYLDPELGTVKFVGGTPGRNAELRLTYTPTFLRVTPGGTAGYSAVNGMWDDRPVSEYVYDTPTTTYYPYWFVGNQTKVSRPSDSVVARNDRYFFAYGRGAAGGGVTARPYSTSMRLGIRLPSRIATNENGSVVAISVAATDGGPALHPFQVDPANGRVYFMAEDEGRPITVNYTGVQESNNGQVANVVQTGTVSLVLEKNEALIAVDEAVNDSEITAFLDPFPIVGRPPLVWMFYTSTRAGGPDVYFQTIAPRFLPSAK